MNDLKTMALAAVSSYETAKDRLFVTVNRTPHPHGVICRVEDLYLNFHVLLSGNDEGRDSVIVTDKMLSLWKISAEELNKVALANTAKLYPPKIGILPIGAATNVTLGLTTVNELNGAVALFYPGMAEKLSGYMGGSYFVIPSSVHELIILPYDFMTPTELKEKVKTVNDSGILTEEDILSYSVYYYDAVAGKFSIAS